MVKLKNYSVLLHIIKIYIVWSHQAGWFSSSESLDTGLSEITIPIMKFFEDNVDISINIPHEFTGQVEAGLVALNKHCTAKEKSEASEDCDIFAAPIYAAHLLLLSKGLSSDNAGTLFVNLNTRIWLGKDFIFETESMRRISGSVLFDRKLNPYVYEFKANRDGAAYTYSDRYNMLTCAKLLKTSHEDLQSIEIFKDTSTTSVKLRLASMFLNNLHKKRNIIEKFLTSEAYENIQMTYLDVKYLLFAHQTYRKTKPDQFPSIKTYMKKADDVIRKYIRNLDLQLEHQFRDSISLDPLVVTVLKLLAASQDLKFISDEDFNILMKWIFLLYCERVNRAILEVVQPLKQTLSDKNRQLNQDFINAMNTTYGQTFKCFMDRVLAVEANGGKAAPLRVKIFLVWDNYEEMFHSKSITIPKVGFFLLSKKGYDTLSILFGVKLKELCENSLWGEYKKNALKTFLKVITRNKLLVNKQIGELMELLIDFVQYNTFISEEFYQVIQAFLNYYNSIRNSGLREFWTKNIPAKRIFHELRIAIQMHFLAKISLNVEETSEHHKRINMMNVKFSLMIGSHSAYQNAIKFLNVGKKQIEVQKNITRSVMQLFQMDSAHFELDDDNFVHVTYDYFYLGKTLTKRDIDILLLITTEIGLMKLFDLKRNDVLMKYLYTFLLLYFNRCNEDTTHTIRNGPFPLKKDIINMIKMEQKANPKINWPAPNSKAFEIKTQFLAYYSTIIAQAISECDDKFEIVVRMLKSLFNAIPTLKIEYLEALVLKIIFSIDYQCKNLVSSPESEEYFNIALTAGHLYIKMKANILDAAKNSPGFDILSQSISSIENNEKSFTKQMQTCLPNVKALK